MTLTEQMNGTATTVTSATTTKDSATSTPASTSNGTANGTAAARRLDPLEVGWQFVQEYYTILNKDPNRLHCFYNKSSLMVHGFEAETVKNSTGQQEIHKRFKELELVDTKVVISNVDSMATLANGILVSVLGELESRGQPVRKFSQVFVLAEQPNGYFVLNDVFRYLKDDSVVYAPPAPIQVVAVQHQQQQQVGDHVAVVEEVVVPVVEPVVEQYQEPIVIDEEEDFVQEQEPSVPVPAPAVVEEKPSEPVVVEKHAPAPAAQSASAKPKSWASLAKTASVDVKTQAVPTKSKSAVTASPVAAKVADKDVKSKPGSPNTSGFGPVEQGEIAVFIRGFSKRTKIQDLKETFAQLVAPAKWIELVSDSSAYIEFSDTELVKKALALKSVLINNETVLIEDRRANGNQPYRRNNRKFMNKSGNQSSSSLNSTNSSGSASQRGSVSGGSASTTKVKKQ